MPCCGAGSAVHATPEMSVMDPLDAEVDYAAMCPGSPSYVRVAAADPMVDEATLCTPRQCIRNCDSNARHFIDICLCHARSSCALCRGIVGSALEADGDLLNTCILHGPSWWANGPDLLFGGTCDIGPTAWLLSLEELEVNICLSGPEGCASGSSSPGLGLTGQAEACFSANVVPVLDDARAPKTSPTPMLS
jgi:hypothetical protein